MGIYDVLGNEIFTCYDVEGSELSYAYDVDGNEIFSPMPSNTFNVMTYNCQTWTGRSGNETLMRGIFDSTNPTIVGLQECRDVGTGGYVPTPFPYGDVETGINNPTAIMSKTPISNFQSFAYQNGSNRGYTKCYITVFGKTIAWFNTHIEQSISQNHDLQIKEIFDVVSQEDSFILTGDFNMRDTTEMYENCVKQFVDAGYNLCNWTTQTGWVDTWYDGTTVATATDKAPADNIITSPDLTITNIEYNTAKLSLTSGQIDHIPIIATIVIQNVQS